MTTAQDMISLLGLQPLPAEGGYFARTWTSPETLPGGRPLGTAIYFLVTATKPSAIHCVDADEIWHFHAGDPLEHIQLVADGSGRLTTLGPCMAYGHKPQVIVPAGTWQGARLPSGRNENPASCGWSLISCTMSPGWDAAGFKLASRQALLASHPSWETLITELNHD